MPKIRWASCHRPGLSQEIWESLAGHTILASNVIFWDKGIFVIQLELNDGRVITVHPVDSVDPRTEDNLGDLAVMEITRDESLDPPIYNGRCPISCKKCQKGLERHHIGTSEEVK